MTAEKFTPAQTLVLKLMRGTIRDLEAKYYEVVDKEWTAARIVAQNLRTSPEYIYDIFLRSERENI